jgi:hypothetical protein
VYVVLALLLIVGIVSYLQYGGDEDSPDAIIVAVEDPSEVNVELEDLEVPGTAEPEASRGAPETGHKAEGSKPPQDNNDTRQESGQRRGI